MAKLTRAEAARIKGTSRAAVTQAVKRGRLKSGKDKTIDTNDPTNRRYFRNPPADGGRSSRRRPAQGEETVLTDALSKIRERMLKCEKLEIENAQKRKELVPTLLAARTMADLGAILGVHFLHLPKRIVPMLIAKVQSGEDARAVEQYLTEELTRGIENFKASAVSKFQEHIAEMDEEDQDAKQEE